MSTVITVENLGKRYLLKHQSNRQPYVALRDVLSDGMKNFGQRLLGRGNSSVSDPRQEEFWALKDVSFEVKQGDRIGIIGRNGAGKSTLLKILSRITEPTTGCIRIKGRVASLLEVGTGFHPELTGRENIFLNGAILGMSRTEIKKKFDEIVDFAEIEKFLDTPVKRFSSGMYVRLAFAVAAHLEPEILVVDEVLAVGDAQFQKKCLGKMEDVSTREGRTVLFVSHNMGAVHKLCNRAILIKHGSLVTDGEPGDAIIEYLNSNKQPILARNWECEETAPQNGALVLRDISICSINNDIINQIYTDIDFNIVITFRVKRDNCYPSLTLLFFDSNNDLIFSSINNLDNNWYGKPKSQGFYKSVCNLPKNMLNNGGYSLGLILFDRNFSDAVTTPELLRFEILDGISLRGDFLGDFGGILRPKLEWQTLSCY